MYTNIQRNQKMQEVNTRSSLIAMNFSKQDRMLLKAYSSELHRGGYGAWSSYYDITTKVVKKVAFSAVSSSRTIQSFKEDCYNVIAFIDLIGEVMTEVRSIMDLSDDLHQFTSKKSLFALPDNIQGSKKYTHNVCDLYFTNFEKDFMLVLDCKINNGIDSLREAILSLRYEIIDPVSIENICINDNRSNTKKLNIDNFIELDLRIFDECYNIRSLLSNLVDKVDEAYARHSLKERMEKLPGEYANALSQESN